MVESEPSNFFPKIGEIVEKADALEDGGLSKRTEEEDEEDRPVEEVESLCMSCGEQVSDQRSSMSVLLSHLGGWS